MTPAEIAETVEGAPEIFVRTEAGDTFDDIPEFYLGQPEAEALVALEKRCKAILTYEGGWKRGHTVFKGCKLPNEPGIDSIRVGFTPDAEMRVFTLEVRKKGWTPNQVRARYTQKFGAKFDRDVSRAATIRIETAEHRVFGSWEEGIEGVGHVIFGFSPEAVERLANSGAESPPPSE